MMIRKSPLIGPMRLGPIRRIWLILLVAILVAASHSLLGQAAPGSTPGKSADAPDDQTTQMEEESAERDVTYIYSRLVYRYDYKSQVGDATANRVRLKGLYSFGPNNRLAFALTIPVVQKDVPGIPPRDFPTFKRNSAGTSIIGSASGPGRQSSSRHRPRPTICWAAVRPR